MSTQPERKAQYENSALKQLMDASEHEICERCYCCDLVNESSPCWSCGGFGEFDDDAEGWPDICSTCGGDGYQYWKECIGRCDEFGNHAIATVTTKREADAGSSQTEGRLPGKATDSGQSL